MFNIITKNGTENVSSFLESSKNCQNPVVFEGALMERPKYTTRRFWSRVSQNPSEICCIKQLRVAFRYCLQSQFFEKNDFFALANPGSIIFPIHIKRPQLSKIKKVGSTTSGFWPPGGFVATEAPFYGIIGKVTTILIH